MAQLLCTILYCLNLLANSRWSSKITRYETIPRHFSNEHRLTEMITGYLKQYTIELFTTKSLIRYAKQYLHVSITLYDSILPNFSCQLMVIFQNFKIWNDSETFFKRRPVIWNDVRLSEAIYHWNIYNQVTNPIFKIIFAWLNCFVRIHIA